MNWRRILCFFGLHRIEPTICEDRHQCIDCKALFEGGWTLVPVDDEEDRS